MTTRGAGWTTNELLAAVTAYMEMLEAESSNQTYSKAAYNKALREAGAPLAGRTKASVEYRMQNISAALDAAGLPYINGYKPAKNVGSKVISQLQTMLIEQCPDLLKPTADTAHLEQLVLAARNTVRKDGEIPAGQLSPATVETARTSYSRCPKVKAWVLEYASGICEGCGALAPFITLEGHPFLEVHHVIPLADGGPDTVDNAVALCPNCHRRCHLSSDRVLFTQELSSKIPRITSVVAE